MGQNQRERLFAAMIACVAEQGFAATTVADLVELSGVSRRSFYDYFGDKAGCLRAVLAEVVTLALGRLEVEGDEGRSFEAVSMSRYQLLARLAAAQPATAKVFLNDAFAAGPAAVEPVIEALRGYEELIRKSSEASPEHAGMPAGLITARTGGVVEIIRARLRAGTEAELPALGVDIVGLSMAYRPPPEPLKLAIRPPKAKPEGLDAADHSERAIRAFATLVAERGYPDVKVEEVVRLASMSTTTFYANFAGKEDLMAAAIDSACAQAVAAVVPAFNRHSSWPEAVRAGFGALLNFLASRPALARLVTVEVYAAGDAAVERRIEALAPLAALLENNTTMWSATPVVVFEMIVGGIAHLLHETVRDSGPESLPGLAPLCTYLTLIPFLGPERSCAAANGVGGGRTAGVEAPVGSAVQRQASAAKPVSYDESMDLTAWKAMTSLAGRDRTAAEIAAETDDSEDVIVEYLKRLKAAGEIELIGERDGEPLYRAAPMHRLNVITARQMMAMSLTERNQLSMELWGMIRAEIDAAAASGIFGRRPDNGMTRTPMWVDAKGWRELKKIHENTLAAGMEIAARSRQRLEESAEPGFEVRSIQAIFESRDSPAWIPKPDEPDAG